VGLRQGRSRVIPHIRRHYGLADRVRLVRGAATIRRAHNIQVDAIVIPYIGGP
jgi:hypothetical protein